MKARQKRLLFVDDEPGIRNTLPAILRRYGFTVTVAATVADALEHIRNQEFDLLLCDLNIQNENDGYDVIRVMREANPECVAIVLTGYPGLESAIEGIHLAIDDYIVKPAKADTLVALLADRLAARQARTRVLTVSYDQPGLKTWTMLLETRGYDVASASDFDSAVELCTKAGFDMFVVGSSVSADEKKKIAEVFRRHSSAPVISVRSQSGEEVSDAGDYHVDPDPERLLILIAEIASKKASAQTANKK